MDFDADGHHDVLSGSFPGELYLFRGGADGTYQPGEKLKDKDGKLINAGQASTAFAADWEQDGDLDLIVGSITGEVFLINNEGTRNQPKYGEPVRLDISDDLDGRRGDSGPIVADWDQDGLHDVLVGTGEGSVLWFRNVGTANEPELAKGEILVEPSAFGFDFAKRQSGQWGARVKVCVTDWNGDGRVDLLLGDRSGSELGKADRSEEERQEIAKAVDELKELKQQIDTCQEELRDLRQAALDNPDNEEISDKLVDQRRELSRLRRKSSAKSRLLRQLRKPKTVRHGFVWLFLRETNTE